MNCGKKILSGILAATVFVNACFIGSITSFAEEKVSSIVTHIEIEENKKVNTSAALNNPDNTYKGEIKWMDANEYPEIFLSDNLYIKFSVKGDVDGDTELLKIKLLSKYFWHEHIQGITKSNSDYDSTTQTYTANINIRELFKQYRESQHEEPQKLSLHFCNPKDSADPSVSILPEVELIDCYFTEHERSAFKSNFISSSFAHWKTNDKNEKYYDNSVKSINLKDYPEVSESDELCIKFSGEGNGNGAFDVTDDNRNNNIFNFLVYSGNGGWKTGDNHIKLGDLIYDEATKTYTAKINTKTILDAFKTQHGVDAEGINLCFDTWKGAFPQTNLIDYSFIKDGVETSLLSETSDGYIRYKTDNQGNKNYNDFITEVQVGPQNHPYYFTSDKIRIKFSVEGTVPESNKGIFVLYPHNNFWDDKSVSVWEGIGMWQAVPVADEPNTYIVEVDTQELLQKYENNKLQKQETYPDENLELTGVNLSFHGDAKDYKITLLDYTYAYDVPATKITLDKTTLSLEKGESDTLVATVEPDYTSDKVVWSSSNEAVATVENGKITAVGGGKATITATAGKVSATCEVTVTVSATGVELSKSAITLEKDAEETLTATVAPENSTDKVVWSSSAPAIADVDQTGKVTAKAVGKATITATAGTATATCKVTVVISATGVTLNKTAIALEKGATETLTATVAPENSTDKVVWSSSDDTIAEVDQTGKVTAVGGGTAIITATAGKVSASCEVTVTVPVASITLDKNTLELKKGATAVLTATVEPSDADDKTVVWKSLNQDVATVDQNGKVPAVASGTAKITATAGGKTAECTVTVTNPATKIEIDDVTVLTGSEKEIVIKTTPTDADDIGNVTYTSADETVAKVVDGKVIGVKAGETTITATAGTLTAQFKVTVTDEEKPATSITLDKTTLSVEMGKTDVLTATVLPADTTDKVVWSSSNEAVATVENGKVTAVSGGKAVITATAGSVSATCEVTVTVPVESVTLDKENISLEKGGSAVLTATVNPSNATDKTVTWESGDETVATVVNGTVTAKGKGTAVITAKAGGKSATCTVTVTVPVESVTLDKNNISLEKGDSADLTATVNPEDASDKTVTWKSSDENIATVVNGRVTAVGEGTATITVTSNADKTKTASCTVKVTVPVVTEPPVTEPSVTEPLVTEPDVTVPDVTEPDVTVPDSTEPDVTVPDETEPGVTVPGTTEPDATVPDETEPDVSVPGSSEPDVSVPETTEPDETKPDSTTPAEPAITEGSASGDTEVKDDSDVKIEIPELNITVEAKVGSFDDAVLKITAEVELKLAGASEQEKSSVIAAAIEGIANADDSVSVNNVISVTLKDQDNNIVQPVDGNVVKVTLPYDGKSNYAAYIDGDVVEFIKLTIANGFASFNAKHFSDYYLVSLSDEAAKAVEDKASAETTTGVNGDTEKPGDDKNDNKPTGIAIALIPAVAAAVSAVVFRKRK